MKKLLHKIKSIFTKKESKKDISALFRNGSEEEQKEFFFNILDQANKEQKELVESVKHL